MSYINGFALTEAIMNGVHLDQAQLISTVDRQKVLNKIYKNDSILPIIQSRKKIGQKYQERIRKKY
ncbi:hypothetical protein ES705_48971 [subsurface metagenome]